MRDFRNFHFSEKYLLTFGSRVTVRKTVNSIQYGKFDKMDQMTEIEKELKKIIKTVEKITLTSSRSTQKLIEIHNSFK